MYGAIPDDFRDCCALAGILNATESDQLDTLGGWMYMNTRVEDGCIGRISVPAGQLHLSPLHSVSGCLDMPLVPSYFGGQFTVTHLNSSVCHTGIQLTQTLRPLDLITVRDELIDQIVDIVRVCISKLKGIDEDGDPVDGYCVNPKAEPPTCHAMTLGSIISSLDEKELQLMLAPQQFSRDYRYVLSIEELLQRLEKIEVVRIFPCHKPCNSLPELVEDARQMVEDYLREL